MSEDTLCEETSLLQSNALLMSNLCAFLVFMRAEQRYMGDLGSEIQEIVGKILSQRLRIKSNFSIR